MKQRFESDTIIFFIKITFLFFPCKCSSFFFFFFLLFFFFFVHKSFFFLSIFIFFVFFRTTSNFSRRIIFIQNMLFVILCLSQKSFNNSNSFHHGVREFSFNVFDTFGYLSKVSSNCVTRNLVCSCSCLTH